MASNAIPADMAPSPITAMVLVGSWLIFLPTLMPRAAETEVELWPAPKGSYWLSDDLVKPERPPGWRRVLMRFLRFVRILWG